MLGLGKRTISSQCVGCRRTRPEKRDFDKGQIDVDRQVETARFIGMMCSRRAAVMRQGDGCPWHINGQGQKRQSCLVRTKGKCNVGIVTENFNCVTIHIALHPATCGAA